MKSSLDREERDSYSIVIQARDNPLAQPAQQLTDSILIKIKVLDVNDNTPKCEQTEYHLEPMQNIEIGTVLAKLKGVDNDMGENAELSYSLYSFNQTNGLFQIDSRSGALQTSKKLFGYSGLYLFELAVRDNGEPSRTGRCPLTIFIKDFNAHPPKFIYPNYNNSSFRIKTVCGISILISNFKFRLIR